MKDEKKNVRKNIQIRINLKIINILHDFINDEAPWRCFVQDVKHRLKRHSKKNFFWCVWYFVSESRES